jgi:sec-independent protein translocase protein TatA
MGSGLVTPVHLIFLLLLALLLFGAKRLPEIGRSLGTGMREFKDSVTSHDDKVEARSELPPPAATPAPPVAPAAPEAPPAAAPPAAVEPERETENVS